MSAKTNLAFKDGMCFEAQLDGHSFLLDADEQFGGKNRGPRPKKLLLTALAGCTGMDVVSILGKMRVEYKKFFIEVEAQLSEEKPQIYTNFIINYCFEGENLDQAKIKKAIELSQERYCGVSAMFRHFAKIETKLKLYT